MMAYVFTLPLILLLFLKFIGYHSIEPDRMFSYKMLHNEDIPSVTQPVILD